MVTNAADSDANAPCSNQFCPRTIDDWWTMIRLIGYRVSQSALVLFFLFLFFFFMCHTIQGLPPESGIPLPYPPELALGYRCDVDYHGLVTQAKF